MIRIARLFLTLMEKRMGKKEFEQSLEDYKNKWKFFTKEMDSND